MLTIEQAFKIFVLDYLWYPNRDFEAVLFVDEQPCFMMKIRVGEMTINSEFIEIPKNLYAEELLNHYSRAISDTDHSKWLWERPLEIVRLDEKMAPNKNIARIYHVYINSDQFESFYSFINYFE